VTARGRAKGNVAPAWVAAYLQPWWPAAEKTPNSRPGRDLLGTPGVAFEVKTGAEWRHGWVRQAAGYAADGELPLLVWLPPGCAEAQVANALAVLPLRLIMPLLVAAGYAPPPAAEGE
jgi:hypothetical protein